MLSKTNFWLADIAAIAVKAPCVQHALLAISAAYVLDYSPSPNLLARTNENYQKAVSLMSEALSNGTAVEQSEVIVSALSLLISDDVRILYYFQISCFLVRSHTNTTKSIKWELRKGRGMLPNWYLGCQLTKCLLDASDPGHRYWNPVNVQCSNVHLANANCNAFACIVAQPVKCLELD